ncbi:PREDICTED: F-box/kelch-repeat protein At3g06240-like [Prunus mume]|uniref:F-box/kelch-repeat protein At3g06240-like n=1 Tax=Prunus mume TaxID=102107 RepID=A0ABM0NC36_PRUMU|nr:PREDICTED: F-box/kelch-repeat protein At3g06240-like [Prunus mume]
MVLPRPNFIVYLKNDDIVRHYFVYDSHTNDYKVLRRVSNYSKLVAVEIYSLVRGSWKTLTASAPAYFGFGITATWPFSYWVVVNDALHWVQLHEQRGKDLVIVSFDISIELFGEIMMPQGVRKIEYPYVDCNIWISKHKGSVALLECSNMFRIGSQPHSWVMEEYGAVESWTKLYELFQRLGLGGGEPKIRFQRACLAQQAVGPTGPG